MHIVMAKRIGQDIAAQEPHEPVVESTNALGEPLCTKHTHLCRLAAALPCQAPRSHTVRRRNVHCRESLQPWLQVELS